LSADRRKRPGLRLGEDALQKVLEESIRYVGKGRREKWREWTIHRRNRVFEKKGC